MKAEKIALWKADLERYEAELATYRNVGLSDEHPLPKRALRRIAGVKRVLAAIESREESQKNE